MLEPYQPRHRADDRDEHRSYTEATCIGITSGGFPGSDPGHLYCPRHWPVDYADAMARHAIDSIR